MAYSGAATSGNVGSVEIASTTTLDGVTIGGEAADWDAVTGTIRGRTGSRFEALEMTYSGTPQPFDAPTQRSDFRLGVGWHVTPEHEVWTIQEPYGASEE